MADIESEVASKAEAKDIESGSPMKDSGPVEAGSRDDPASEADMEARNRLERLLEEYGSTWDGTDDINDPYNWSSLRKVTIGVIFSISQLVTIMSASMIAAALGDISRDLHIDASTAQITLSTYFLGLGYGPFLVAAVSEMYGRKRVWIFFNAWFVLFNAISPVGNSKVLMILGRLMTGVGASVGVTLTGPVMADLYREQHRGKSLAIASLLPYLGPALGPIVGGLVTQLVRWQWIFWIMSLVNTGVTLIGIICIRESYTPVLLRRKAAARLDPSLHASVAPWSTSFWKNLWSRLSGHLMRPLRLLAMRPIIQIIAFVQALDFGVYACLLSSYATLWIERYGESEFTSSLHYISIAIGCSISGQAGGHAMDRIYTSLRKRTNSAGKPEFRVPYMIPGMILMPIGLFWYGWSAQGRVSWVCVDFGVAVFTLGSFVASQAMYAYQLDEFAEYGASANAASRVVSYTLAFVFPIFTPQLYGKLGYGWGNSLLGFVVIACGFPIPVILWIWGPKLRKIGKKE